MSAPAETALQQGFNALADQFSQVELDGVSLPALVNSIDPRERREPNFDPRADSVILLKTADLESVPAAGESFLDSAGRYHRVLWTSHRGDFLRCYCHVSNPTS